MNGAIKAILVMRKALLLIALLWCLSGVHSFALAGPIFTNSLGLEFLWIPAGEFTADDEGDSADKSPARQVTVEKPFYLGKYEVTQAQWSALMGGRPGKFKGNDHPVESVSWHDAQFFIRLLNEREGTDKYRLPTEAEWEYAARAGVSSGLPADDVSFQAWYNFNSGGGTHPAGQKKANAFGLHDLHGNVSEWVADIYEKFPAPDAAVGPAGSGAAGHRVARGCSWRHDAGVCRAGQRFYFDPDERHSFIGFRVLREVE